MGSECKPSKFHYDIAMSKRTRKPSYPVKVSANLQECDSAEESSEKVDGKKDGQNASYGQESQENEKKKSLKQFIEGRSLSQHFTEEENQLQLFVKQPEEGFHRVKFKRMVSRYARVLSHLIKLKRNPEMAFRKKPVLQLTN